MRNWRKRNHQIFFSCKLVLSLWNVFHIIVWSWCMCIHITGPSSTGSTTNKRPPNFSKIFSSLFLSFLYKDGPLGRLLNLPLLRPQIYFYISFSNCVSHDEEYRWATGLSHANSCPNVFERSNETSFLPWTGTIFAQRRVMFVSVMYRVKVY